jgi:hypothetical protein
VKPTTRVCPRCGDEVGQEQFCKTCGLNLHKQSELPTRLEWQALPETKRRGASFLSSLSTVQKVGGAGLIVVVTAAVLLATRGSDGPGPEKRKATNAVTEADAGPPPEQRCVDLWNTSSQIGKSLLPTFGQLGDLYVSVYFAPAYPDKCVVDVFVPNYGTAYEFLEGGFAGDAYSYSEISDQDPPPFNAVANSDGTIALQP